MQLFAIVTDTYRSLKARGLFWVVLWLSVVLVVAFASVGCNASGWYMGYGLFQQDSAFLRAGTPWEKSLLLTLLWGLIDWWLMTFAVVLAMFPASTIFPDTMQAGTVDLLLSKPVGRLKLFLGKYLGSLLFVAMQALIVAGGVFLTLYVRLHEAYWSVFYSVGLTVLIFSFVYCVNVFFGVVTRSSVAAVLWSVLFWFVLWLIQYSQFSLAKSAVVFEQTLADEGRQISKTMQQVDRTLTKVMWVLPKTRATGDLANRIIRADSPYTFQEILARSISKSEEEFQHSRALFSVAQKAEQRLDNPLWFTVGTSLAFEIAVLLLAFWRFATRDF
ncbi:MAG: ABC transporter permease subunit [Verrucomicrobiales bacterium]|nr:ABC transporter permease subunit [Verrucomicrobiales bacterium]